MAVRIYHNGLLSLREFQLHLVLCGEGGREALEIPNLVKIAQKHRALYMPTEVSLVRVDNINPCNIFLYCWQ